MEAGKAGRTCHAIGTRAESSKYKASMELFCDYSHESLLRQARSLSPVPPPKKAKVSRQFDPSRYSTRLIALKFAYLGQSYNGLEYHANNTTPYPTVEEEIWKAMYKAKLIFPIPNSYLRDNEPNWEGCEYSKAGRTDKGVSAFGQVIGIRVRSNRPLDSLKQKGVNGEEEHSTDDQEGASDKEMPSSTCTEFDSVRDEIPYPQILNRLLPSEIRVLAWCPSPPADFSARFHCEERRYKYFFTQPAFAPKISSRRASDAGRANNLAREEGWLEIRAMQEAARKFRGSHDFRNFCKVDPSKQIDNFTRRINYSEVEEVDHGVNGRMDNPSYTQSPDQLANGTTHQTTCETSSTSGLHSRTKTYAFKIQGSGFLWHQVRHIVAILFLIGQGLESPSLIDDLLDITKIPAKPTYDMADASPLVLEDCKFDSLGLLWVYLDDYTGKEAGIAKVGGKGNGKYGLGGAVDELWKVWHRHKIDETLAGSLLDLTMRGYEDSTRDHGGDWDDEELELQEMPRHTVSQKVYMGGDSTRLAGKYITVLQRPRMETVDAINAKYLKRKGLDPPVRKKAELKSSIDAPEE
ncbi:MAG: hypothetical protein Q9222_002657 [Ikaeria aurantiellina]